MIFKALAQAAKHVNRSAGIRIGKVETSTQGIEFQLLNVFSPKCLQFVPFAVF